MKTCTKCLKEKDIDCFPTYKKSKGGVHSQCRKCLCDYQRNYKRTPKAVEYQRNYQRRDHVRQYQKEYKEKNRQRLLNYHRNRWLKVKYGISQKDYEKMFKEQGGRCAICLVPHELLAVDHDHKTGDIRQLLCNPCNQGIGMLREDCQVLRSAIKYLEKHHPSRRRD